MFHTNGADTRAKTAESFLVNFYGKILMCYIIYSYKLYLHQQYGRRHCCILMATRFVRARLNITLYAYCLTCCFEASFVYVRLCLSATFVRYWFSLVVYCSGRLDVAPPVPHCRGVVTVTTPYAGDLQLRLFTSVCPAVPDLALPIRFLLILSRHLQDHRDVWAA